MVKDQKLSFQVRHIFCSPDMGEIWFIGPDVRRISMEDPGKVMGPTLWFIQA